MKEIKQLDKFLEHKVHTYACNEQEFNQFLGSDNYTYGGCTFIIQM